MASMLQQGLSMRAMARMLGRSASTISRELGRKTPAELPYASHSAQVSSQGRCQAARPTRELDMQGVGWSVVLILLDWKWSRQQNAGTLEHVFPNEPERHVSRETIGQLPPQRNDDHLRVSFSLVLPGASPMATCSACQPARGV